MREMLTLVTIILLIPLVYSFNFGTVPKNNYEKIQQGQSTHYTILFWNLGQSSYPVSVEMLTELPGWDIIVRPQNFILKPTSTAKPPYGDGEYIEIPERGIVEVETLRVFVKTPNYVEPGTYELVLVARAGDLTDQVSVLQEREFKLKLEVEKNPTVFERTYESLKLTGKKVVERSKEVKNTATGMVTSTNFSPLLVFIGGLILILLIILLVVVK